MSICAFFIHIGQTHVKSTKNLVFFFSAACVTHACCRFLISGGPFFRSCTLNHALNGLSSISSRFMVYFLTKFNKVKSWNTIWDPNWLKGIIKELLHYNGAGVMSAMTKLAFKLHVM